MSEKENTIFPLTRTDSGEYGIVKTDVKLMNSEHIDEMPEIYTMAQRFSHDGELIVKVEIQTILTNFEAVYITLIVQANQYKRDITLSFHNYNYNDCVYSFTGDEYNTFGISTNGLIITPDMYGKMRSKAVELCNPNTDYKINDIIDILRESQNQKIIDWLVEWDIRIGKNQDTKQGKK